MIAFKYLWRKPARSQLGYSEMGWVIMTDDPNIPERISDHRLYKRSGT